VMWKHRWLGGVLLLVSLGMLTAGVGYWSMTRGPGRSGTGDIGGAPVQPLDPSLVELGRGVYQTSCLVCHGANAEGQLNWRQQNPDGTYAAPPHDSSGHTWHHGDGLLFRIVRDGGTIYETPGFKSMMPAFGDRLSEEEVRAVITYFKSLWSPQGSAFQAEVSLEDPFP